MGRRSGFVGFLSAVARESARNQRQAIAAQNRYQRDLVRQARENERAYRAMEKEEKQRYLESRIRETDEANADLSNQFLELQSILSNLKDNKPSFKTMKKKYHFRTFHPEPIIGQMPCPPDKDTYFLDVESSFLGSLIPGASRRKQERIDAANKAYALAVSQFESHAKSYTEKLNKLKVEYDSAKANYEKSLDEENKTIDEFEQAYRQADLQAIIDYHSLALENSVYPDDFPQDFKIAYAPDSKELIIDYELPAPEIVPVEKEYKYNKTKDAIESKPRKAAEIKEIYSDIVASIALRTLHETFISDVYDYVLVAVFNGYIQSTDPGTGKHVSPYLVSVRTTKEVFLDIVLDRVDKAVCLRNLGASVSPRPHELQAVKPIVDFNMVDKRFIEQSDILDSIDSRPNLYELTPSEFESLISNLFGKHGLETKLTRTSKDGGVDVVAFDLRPVVGGKVVIQAKRYKNTVGVSAVRDLYGTMMNEGANKGILVTTSGYGPDAFNFAKDKPIELLDGGRLLYLLSEIGVNARIIFPEDQNGFI